MARNVDPRRLLELEQNINALNDELDELDSASNDPNLSDEERADIQRDIEEATAELVDLEDERASLEDEADPDIYTEDMFDDDGY